MIKVEHFHNLTPERINQKLRRSKDTREYERWVCIKCSMEGLSVQIIGSILGRNEQTIREWITAFNQEGEPSIHRISPLGQKKNDR